MAVLVCVTLFCSMVLVSAAEKTHESFLPFTTAAAELEKNLTSMQAKVLSLEQRDNQSQVTMDVLRRSISGLENKLTVSVGKVAALEGTVTNLLAKYKELENRLSKSEAKVDNLQRTVSTLVPKSSFEALKNQQASNYATITRNIDSLKNQIAESRKDVSFLAVDLRTEQHVPGHGIVQFPSYRHRSPTSAGYGFNTATGKFRCPVTGLYAFFFHTTTQLCDKWFTFEIKRDSTTLVGTYAVTKPGVCNLPMSASVVTPCWRGQYVYVQNPYNGILVIDSYTNAITHFAGVLIKS